MQDLASVYGAVIDDVCTKVRSEFIQEGNESVLEELRSLWEEKLLQTGILDTAGRPDEDVKPLIKPDLSQVQTQQGFAQPTYGVQQLPMYQQPLTNINSRYLQPVHPLQQPLHNHISSQPAAVHAIGQPQAHMPSQQSVHRHGQMQSMPSANTVSFVQPTRPVAEHYNYGNVQPQQWSGNNAVDSRKRKAETLQVPYGASTLGPLQKQERLTGGAGSQPLPSGTHQAAAHSAYAIPQQDGPADAPADTAAADTADGSLDNLSDVEVDDDDIEQKMLPDFILGQYESVKRIKNRWRCTLNHCVMHLNGQDIVVSKASGEFTF